MSWVTFVWALVIAASVVMALPHLFVGLRERAAANLFFVLSALSVAGIAFGELAIMHSPTAAEAGRAIQWTHVPILFLYVGVVGFVGSYFGTGRRWLGIAAIGVRLITLAINFALPPNLNFREMTGLRPLAFLGDTISFPQGVTSSWTRLGELSSLLMVAFVIDASIRLWRRGGPEDRRRAAVIGGAIVLFIVLAAGLSALILRNIISSPFLISLPFLGVIIAMGVELSHDILRSMQTTRELRASEAALRESETRMSLAANAGGLGLWTWNVARDELWLSDNGRALFGFAPSEPLNIRSFLNAIHPEDRSLVEASIHNSFAGGGGGEYQREYRIVRPDGQTRWIAGYGCIDVDAHGQPTFFRGVARDITERKVAEEAVRDSEARFRIVADVAPVMIWMLDTEKKGIFFNRRWLDFTGRRLDQELGAGWLEGIHSEDLGHTANTRGTAFQKREPFTVEYRLRSSDGDYHWLLDTGTPRFHENGEFLGYIGSCIDISERKQAEFDYQLQSTELARVGRVALIGELATSLAHEVNNPLGAMVANASAGQRLLAQGRLPEEDLRELLADIVADGHRAREVIHGIRNMVRKGETSHAPVELKVLIRDLLRIVRADAIARNVSLIAEVHPTPGVVMADPVQLLQVLLNLTINAFEAVNAVRPGARRVTVRAEHPDNGSVCLSVRDSGPGFPNGIAEKLFEPFFSTKAEGTGMGLAIARSIIETHGGTLSAENCADGGACFTIRLAEATEASVQAA